MDDYIKREDAIAVLKARYAYAEEMHAKEQNTIEAAVSWFREMRLLDMLIERINNIEAANVRENVKTSWVRSCDGPMCVNCDYVSADGFVNYCPNCGADMRGKTNETE